MLLTLAFPRPSTGLAQLLVSGKWTMLDMGSRREECVCCRSKTVPVLQSETTKGKEGLSHAGAHIHLVTSVERSIPESPFPQESGILRDDSFRCLQMPFHPLPLT